MTTLRTLDEAKAWLREHVSEGARCPCCNQFAKVYRRKISVSSALAIVAMYRAGARGDSYVHLATLLKNRHADEAKLVHWGLIRELAEPRDDRGRAGWWVLTDAGVAWIEGRSTVPKYARIYDGQCLNLTGEPVSISDALGTDFKLDELMRTPG